MKRVEYEGLILRDKMKLTKSKLKETIRKVLRERIQLDTTEYQFSHGKKPRGWGRWMFAKDKKVNTSSLLGYYADVKFVNNSTTKAELFSVGSEIAESSK